MDVIDAQSRRLLRLVAAVGHGQSLRIGMWIERFLRANAVVMEDTTRFAIKTDIETSCVSVRTLRLCKLVCRKVTPRVKQFLRKTFLLNF